MPIQAGTLPATSRLLAFFDLGNSGSKAFVGANFEMIPQDSPDDRQRVPSWKMLVLSVSRDNATTKLATSSQGRVLPVEALGREGLRRPFRFVSADRNRLRCVCSKPLQFAAGAGLDRLVERDGTMREPYGPEKIVAINTHDDFGVALRKFSRLAKRHAMGPDAG